MKKSIMFKGICLFLAICMLLGALPVTAYAEENTDDAMMELLTAVFQFSDNFDNLGLGSSYGDLIQKYEGDNLYDDALIESADDYITEFIEENDDMNDSYRASDEEISVSSARSTAIMYAMAMADWNVKQESGKGRIFEDEAKYMFISHYIDQPVHYWEVYDPRILMNGHNAAGLPRWITDSDRDVYKGYMSVSSAGNNIRKIGDLAYKIRSFQGEVKDIFKEKDDYWMLNQMVDSVNRVVQNIEDPSKWSKDDILTSMSKITTSVCDIAKSATQNTTMAEFVDDFYQLHDELGETYDRPTWQIIVKSSVALACSVLKGAAVGGLAGGAVAGVTHIAHAAVKLSFKGWDAMFNYVGWVSMRYSYSQRYAYRQMRQLGML